MRKEHTERGAATVEIIAAMPFVVFFLMLVIEFSVVMFDQLAVTQAAREGARAAAVSPDRATAVAAVTHATGLNSKNMSVEVGPRPQAGGLVKVTVGYTTKVEMPFSGVVLASPVLKASASMMVEGPGA